MARRWSAEELACSQMPLNAVHIAASVSDDPTGCRLHMPDMPAEQAVQTIRQEALRWTYLLRSRKRWVADRRARERNEAQARDALANVGIHAKPPSQPDGPPAPLSVLGASDLVVVRIPWNGAEQVHWESRIFPWEYVLSAATRQTRLARSTNGRSPTLTVVRELQRQSGPADSPVVEPPVASAPSAQRPPKILFVECVPSELAAQWDVSEERTRLAQVLPAGTTWVVAQYPTPQELLQLVRQHHPTLIHVAGLDSHQGLRELRLHFGASAEVDLDTGREWLRKLGGDVTVVPEVPVFRKLVDEVLAEPRLMLDGVLLRNDAGLPLLVRAHDLARLLRLAQRPAWLITFNLWNTAARVAPLVVAEGAAAASLGFQDAFEDSLADFVHATLYRMLVEKGWNLPQAFIQTWEQVRRLPETMDATGITLWTGAPVLPLFEAPPQRQRPPRQADVLRCTVKPLRELNYAVLHNAQPLFDTFVLECDNPEAGRIVDVEVDVHMGFEKASFQRRVVMDRVRVALTRDVHVPLTAELARTAQEAITSSITVRVQCGKDVLYRDTHRLRLLPVDQWRDNRRDGRWLPSFVLPRDDAVQHAVEHAQRYNRVLRDDPNAGFEGYQAAMPDDEDSLRSVDRQVEAIWATLLHDWRLGYINPPPAYSGALDSQRLRSPSMIHERRSGTCIDLALLLAACLELIDIYPVIFLLEGHALPGWWRHPSFRDEYAAMADDRLADVVTADAFENSVASAQLVSWHTGKASHAEIKRWIQQRKLVPIETVRLTENCGFVEAIEAGVQALSQRSDFDSMIEVVTARYELVTPLPMMKGLP